MHPGHASLQAMHFTAVCPETKKGDLLVSLALLQPEAQACIAPNVRTDNQRGPILRAAERHRRGSPVLCCRQIICGATRTVPRFGPLQLQQAGCRDNPSLHTQGCENTAQAVRGGAQVSGKFRLGVAAHRMPFSLLPAFIPPGGCGSRRPSGVGREMFFSLISIQQLARSCQSGARDFVLRAKLHGENPLFKAVSGPGRLGIDPVSCEDATSCC